VTLCCTSSCRCVCGGIRLCSNEKNEKGFTLASLRSEGHRFRFDSIPITTMPLTHSIPRKA